MHRLAADALVVDLLDPADPADAVHLGARFGHGGFIWQAYQRDHAGALTPLLAGPEFPAPSPDPFNGQGLPESFRHRRRDGSPLTWSADGRHGLAIGAGTLALDAAGQPLLVERCHWRTTLTLRRAEFRTSQAAAGHACDLVRCVELHGAEIVSTSTLTNTGSHPLALQWFAHPFWPLVRGTARITLPATTTVSANPGFAVAADGRLTFQRPFERPDDSQFALLALPPSQPLQLTLNHPHLTRLTFSTSFAPDECPVWANARTVSVEPYLNLRLAPGESRAWEIRHGCVA